MERKSFTSFMAILLLAVIIITFVLVAFVSNYYIRQNLLDNAIEKGQNNVSSDETALRVYLSNLRRLSMELYYNVNVYTILYEDELSFSDTSTVFAFLQSLINLSNAGEITQIYMHLFRPNCAYLVGETGRSAENGAYRVEIPANIEKYQVYCEAPHESHSYGMSQPAPEEGPVCSFHWYIYDAMGDAVIGTLSFDIRIDKLANYLASARNGTPVYLLDGDGNVIYNNIQVLENALPSPAAATEAQESWFRIDEPAFQGIAFVQNVESDLVNWRLIELKTWRELLGTANRILLWDIVLMSVACFICAAAIVLLVVRLTQPLRGLRAYVQTVEKGNLAVNIWDYTDYHRQDEIGILILHLENMMNTVNDMFVRQQKLSNLNRSIEMKTLLNQINPHFIYNALQSISTLALVHNDTDVYRLLVKLGAQMQYSMNLSQEVAELYQEVQYTENYFVLQQQRFENRFVYEIHMDSSLEHITIPRMTLQPLAENAIRHGEIHRISSGFVRIMISRVQSKLKIQIEDNGIGCPEEKREALNELFRNTTESDIHVSEHIGMLNVLYRLKLLYGSGASMQILESGLGGTLVEVEIPLDQYKEVSNP